MQNNCAQNAPYKHLILSLHLYLSHSQNAFLYVYFYYLLLNVSFLTTFIDIVMQYGSMDQSLILTQPFIRIKQHHLSTVAKGSS